MTAQYKTLEMPISGSAITSESKDSAPALLVNISSNQQVAFAVHHGVEILESPIIQPVPCSSAYGLGMINWQNTWIPLIDLEVLATPEPKHSPNPRKLSSEKNSLLRLALVLAYNINTEGDAATNSHNEAKKSVATDDTVGYGSVLLHRAPSSISVTNQDQCQLPKNSKVWRHIALSCFRHEGKPIPILSPQRLFNSAWI